MGWLPGRWLTLAHATLGVGAVLIGCTDGGDGGAASTTRSVPPAQDERGAAGDVPTAQLRVRLEEIGRRGRESGGVPLPMADGGGIAPCTRSLPATCTVQVTCPADDRAGDGMAVACQWLATHPEALEEADERRVCTEQYGGPERASVSGTLDGTNIDVNFSRTDGCEIARWDAAQPVWTGEILPNEGGGVEERAR